MAAFYRGPSGGAAVRIIGTAAYNGFAFYYYHPWIQFSEEQTVVALAVEFDTQPSGAVEVSAIVDGGDIWTFNATDDDSETGSLTVPADTDFYLKLGQGSGDWVTAVVTATLESSGPGVIIPMNWYAET